MFECYAAVLINSEIVFADRFCLVYPPPPPTREIGERSNGGHSSGEPHAPVHVRTQLTHHLWNGIDTTNIRISYDKKFRLKTIKIQSNIV